MKIEGLQNEFFEGFDDDAVSTVSTEESIGESSETLSVESKGSKHTNKSKSGSRPLTQRTSKQSSRMASKNVSKSKQSSKMKVADHSDSQNESVHTRKSMQDN
jgi:hypothetical protein